MNQKDFKDSPSGHLVPTIQGCMAFVPNQLPPRTLNLNSLVPLIARANLALGELSGIGRTLPNPFLLIRPFMRIEAVASSKIEGTVTTLTDLFAFEIAADRANVRSDTREVHNYIEALRHGVNRVNELPVSRRLIQEVHEILLSGVSPARGAQYQPGEFKTDQNWIGSRLISNARFVPPPPAESENALSRLEEYIHDQSEELPLLVKLALIHYQFETIHPFPDGNGRVGRLLIPLILSERKAISHPLLYLSPFFEKNFDIYIDRMFEVSKSGAWEDWIEFFLIGIERASNAAIKKAHAIQDLRSEYQTRIQKSRSSALCGKLIDTLFNVPAITIPHATVDLGITYNSAKNHIQRLVELGILSEDREEKRPQWFFAHQILSVAYRENSDDYSLEPKTEEPEIQSEPKGQLSLI